MKKLLLIIAVLCGLFASAQISNVPGYAGRNTRDHVIATMADSGLHVPVFAIPRIASGIGVRSGGLFVDTVGGGKGLYYVVGGVPIRLADTTDVGSGFPVSNGIRRAVDTIQLGGIMHRATHIQMENHQTSGAEFTYLHLTNRPNTATLIQEDTVHPSVTIYNPSSLAAEAVYEESAGDTAYLHYGGRIGTVVRNTFDSTSTIFSASNKYILLPSNGFEGVYQFMIPRDSTIWRVGRDGQSANVGHFQWDLGQTYGYNTNVVPENGIPGFPLTTVLSSIDLMRNIDNDRSHKMSGAGVTGYMSRYKTYQNTINMSTYEAGNYTDSVFGYKAYGDTYPLISVATKAKTLAVWDVKNAFGFYAQPQYRYTNTVRNGYGFYAAGDSDQNRFNFVRIGGVVSNFNHQLEVTGDVFASDTIGGLLTGGQGMFVRIDRSIGNEAGINFSMKDSVVTATIATYMPDDRDQRYLYIREEAFTSGAYPDNSPGAYIRFETGGNHANVSRISRNGNWTFGNSTAALNKRWYKKGAFSGGLWVEDTLTLNAAALQAVDTVNYKMLVRNTTTGDVLTMPFVGPGGGGGGGVTSVGAGYGMNFSTITSTGNVVADSSSGGLQTYLRGMKIIDSMVAVNNTRYWNLSGNSATSGKETGSFVGTTNSVALRFGTNGTRRMYLDSARAQLVIGAPTINANDALIIQGLSGSGNYDGITMYPNNLSTKMTYGPAGMQRAGSYDINTSSGSISLSPNTGVIIGTSFGTPTALLHINGSTTSRAQVRLISTGSLPTSGNILAGNIDAISDKIYYTIATGPAQKEFTLNDAALTSGTTPVATTNGRLTDGLILAQGTYTPTVAEVTNGGGASLTTAYTCQYQRVGNVVTVSGKITIDANAISTKTEISMTLPIASNFSAEEQAGGAAVCTNNGIQVYSVVANAAADKVYFTGYPASSVNDNYNFSFTYLIQ